MPKYSPTVPPTKEDQLLPFLDDEFVRIGQSINDLEAGFWGVSENTPEKLRPGLVKYFAAGVVGPKEGLYTYGKDEVWRYGGVQTALPGDWIPLGAPANGSTQVGNCAYRINSAKDTMTVTFFLSGGTIGTTTGLWTLPTSARPQLDLPYQLFIGTPAAQTLLTFPPPSNPGASQYDQIINILQNATASTAVSGGSYVLFKTNGVIEVTFVPTNGTVFGGTFTVPLPVAP